MGSNGNNPHFGAITGLVVKVIDVLIEASCDIPAQQAYERLCLLLAMDKNMGAAAKEDLRDLLDMTALSVAPGKSGKEFFEQFKKEYLERVEKWAQKS